MKKMLSFTASFLLFCSCAQVYFSSPQPLKGTTIKSFINDIQGAYADSLIEIVILKNELVISGKHYILTSKKLDENQVLVKYYNDLYFASFKDSIYFSVFMAKFYEDKLAIYMLNADEYSVNNLKQIVKVDKIEDETKGYLTKPSKKEFDKIIDYGFFEVINVLKKK